MDNHLDIQEVTMKDVILNVKRYVTYCINHFYIIALSGLMLAIIFFARLYMKDVLIEAELTYMLYEDEVSSDNGLYSVLGQFGFGGGVGGSYNLDRIVSLSYSNNILNSVLQDSLVINGETDCIGNHIISIYQLHQEWEDSEYLDAFWFKEGEGDQINTNKARKVLISKLKGDGNDQGILYNGYKEDTGILDFTAKTPSEDLSIGIVKSLYTKLSQFYVDKKIEGKRRTHLLLSRRLDSVKVQLYNKEYKLAGLSDRKQSVYLKRDRVLQSRLNRDVQTLSILYGEVLKNKETAGFILENATPFFQIVDEPVSPIEPEKKNYALTILVGGFVGGVLALFILIIVKGYQDIMYGNIEVLAKNE
jgi:hypothetical protein